MSGRGGRGGRGGGRGGSRGKPAPPGMPGGDDPSLIVNDQPQETYPVHLPFPAYPWIPGAFLAIANPWHLLRYQTIY